MEDYKQKYESALKVASKWHKDGIKDIQLVVECIFPELKESEDEKIRKDLIGYFEACGNMTFAHHRASDIIAWLEKQDHKKHEEELENAYKCADEVQYRRGYEDAKREFKKQGEQNLANKVEPKFKIGDKVYAIRNRFECTIESIDGTTYYGNTTNFDIKDQDNWKLVEQKSVWSEWDENMVIGLISIVEDWYNNMSEKEKEYYGDCGYINWLKSLKERMKGE